MTTSNVTLTTHLLAKRGNTAVSTTYTGLMGELTVDTDLNTVRVHDGSTAGGHILANTSQTDAANLAISTLNANVGAYQSYANTSISTLTANAAVQAAVLDTLTGNAVTQHTELVSLTANAATQADELAVLLANAASQADDLAGIVAFQTYANSTFITSSTVDALDANLGTATTNITTLQSQVYANANVKTYLSEFDGNIIPSANATFYLGDSTHQWKELWVTGNTIYLGDIPLSMSTSSDATLYVNNQPVVANVTNLIDANIGATTENVTNIDANIGSYQTWANTAFLDSTDLGNFTLTNNSITTDSGDDGIDLYINGATSDDPPALVMRKWRFSSLGTIQFLDPFTSITLANGTISTTKIGQWDNVYANLIPSINANLGTATTNITTLDGSVDTINANIGAYQAYANATFSTDTALNANVGAFQTYSNTAQQTLDANLGTATTNITTIDANVGAFQTYSNAQGYISNIVEDTTPQLGGNLDMNSKSITGSLQLEDGTQERFSSLTSATGTVAHDCANGTVFYHTSISANFTANFTNLELDSSYATAITLVLVQGGTAYIPNAVQIGGVGQTINWQGNAEPTGTINRIDAVSFTILNNSGTYTVLGQLTDF